MGRWSGPAWSRPWRPGPRGARWKSSTCARCPRWTWRPSPGRCGAPAGASWPTRPRSSAAWGRRSRPGSPRSASTSWNRRCCGWAASPPRIPRRGWKIITCPTWTGCWTPSTAPSRSERAGMTESATTQRREFRLPDVGEGLTEADIVAWRVKPGDTVIINQIIVDIETAKAVVELPSPYAGVVAALLVSEGQTVDVGTPIIAVDVPGAPGGAAPVPAPPARPEAEPEPVPEPVPVPTDPAVIAAEGPRPSSEDLVPPVPPPAERQAVLVGYWVKAGATP